MSEEVKIVTVDETNVDEYGFFCYKSKPKSAGYQQKLAWLRQRFAEGMCIKILFQGKRSVGFVETMPGEFAWRAVHAPGYRVVHCIWVVGRAKKKGYGRRLLDECMQDAREASAHGVAAVTSSRVWLAGRSLFLKAGFEVVHRASPCFELLVKRLDSAPPPAFPQDWPERRARFGPGLTIVRSGQCPYIEDGVQGIVQLARGYGTEAQIVEITSGRELQERAPSAYGTFDIVHDGELLSHHVLGRKLRETLSRRLAG
jgi:ribosomal protein S18 acetylase RimI-like enzyme